MGNITSAIASQQLPASQAVALSGIKKSAQQSDALAAILDQSAQTVAASSRGQVVNISV